MVLLLQSSLDNFVLKEVFTIQHYLCYCSAVFYVFLKQFQERENMNNLHNLTVGDFSLTIQNFNLS